MAWSTAYVCKGEYKARFVVGEGDIFAFMNIKIAKN